MDLTLTMDLLTEWRQNCPICNYKASCTCKYQTHIETHSDPFNKTQFKCSFCDQRVKTLLRLREHMFVHVDRSEKFKCFVCNVFCKSEKNFKDHIWLHQSLDAQQTFECMYCEHKANTVNSMKMHMLIHKNYLAVQECCLCGYKSKNKGNLLRHFVRHKESPNSDLFTCNFCKYKTRHLSALRLHLQSHRNKIEVFKCCVCDHECHSKLELAKHFLIHKYPSKLDSFKCSFCDYSTSYLQDFRLHVLTHNRSLDNSDFCICVYNCHLCNYRTKNESDFESHLKCPHINLNFGPTENKQYQRAKPPKKTNRRQISANYLAACQDGSDVPKYQCDECPFQTTLYKSLRRHKEVHKDRSERKLFDCTSCGASFTTKTSLKQHMLGHMDPEERPMLHCDWCDHKTIYKSHLKKHIQIKHLRQMGLELNSPQSTATNERTTYKCKDCPYETKTYVNLTRHEGIHKDRSERQLYQCAICSSTFTVKKSLKEHILSQHTSTVAPPKFECYDCDFITADKYEMDLHRWSHTSNSSAPSRAEHVENRSEQERQVSTETLESTSRDNQTESSFGKADGDPQVLNNEDSWESPKYQCGMCPFNTMALSNFKRHQETHKDRSERKLFDCTTCGASFTTKTSLRKHTLVHVNPEERPMLHCEWCKYETIHRSHLKRHMKLKHKTQLEFDTTDTGEEPVYKCSECSYETKFVVNLKRHEGIHKDRSERQLYQCDTCSATFTVKKSLRKHILLQHSNSVLSLKFQCYDCDFVTDDKFEITSHRRTHTAISQEPQNEEAPEQMQGIEMIKVENDWEENQTETSAELTGDDPQIINNPDPWNPPIYQCEVCSFCTMQPSTFKRHKEIHKDRSERQLYKCTSCDTTFTTRTSLKQHSLLHVEPEKRPMFQCDKCDYKTIYRSSLKGHLKSRHSEGATSKPESTKSKQLEHILIKDEPEEEFTEERDVSNNKESPKIMKFQCDICAFQTMHTGRFNRHKQTHKDRSERSLFYCKTCGSDYTSKAALKQHELLHRNPGDIPRLYCEWCEYSTMYKCSLKEHVKSKHSEGATSQPASAESKPKTVQQCKECPYETEFIMNLKRHEETHKDRSQRKLYQCATCDCNYTVKKSLEDHVMREHLYPNNRPKFQCNDCKFISLSKYEIKTHTYIHAPRSTFTEIQPYKIVDESNKYVVESEEMYIKQEMETGVEETGADLQ